MSSDQQHQLSRRSRERQTSGFHTVGNQPHSRSEKFSQHSQAQPLSETACNSSRIQQERDDAFIKEKSLLSRSSVVRSFAQRTPLRSGRAGETADAAVAAINVLAAQSHHAKGAAAKNEDDSIMSSVNSRLSRDCGSLGGSLRGVCSLTTPPAHSAVKGAKKSDELPSVVGTDSSPAVQDANLHADSNFPTYSASTKGALLSFSMTASRNYPLSSANERLTRFDSSIQRSLSMSRQVVESGFAGSESGSGVTSICSPIGGATSARTGATESGYQGGGASLHVSSSDADAKMAATPSPPARLNQLHSTFYPSSTPAVRAISPPNLSRRWSRVIRTSAARSKLDSSNALPSLRRSPSLRSISTGSASDETSAVSAAPSAQGLTGAGSAGPVLMTTVLSRGDSSISPRQHLLFCSASPSSPSRAAVKPVVRMNSTDSITSLSGTASSSSQTPRLQPQPPSLQPSPVAVVANAPSATVLPVRHASARAKVTEVLSVVELHAAPIPLRNFGATCYLNSVVQCLLCTPGLLSKLDDDRQRIVQEWERGRRLATKRTPGSAYRRSCAQRKTPATSSLIDLGTAHPAHGVPVPQLLLSLKAACAEYNDEFMSNGQNDAHEFLLTLLGVIDKEVRRSKPGSYEAFRDVEDEKKSDAYVRWVRRLQQENNSTVYDLFGGVTGSTVRCASCRLISYRFEALLGISLPMKYRNCAHSGETTSAFSCEKRGCRARAEGLAAVDELLREMFFSERGEFLSGPMQVMCDRCKKLRDKTIWLSMEQWPPVLVLHLKRFNNAGIKNEEAVVFPYTFRPFEDIEYQLYGICCHRGTSSYGHYTSYTYVQEKNEAAAALLRSANAAATKHPEATEPSLKGTNSDHAVSLQELQGSGRVDGVSRENGDGEGVDEGRSRRGSRRADGKRGCVTAGTTTLAGRWYLCNDDIITEVTASDVLSMTKEAYILFYRRVDEGCGGTY